ncbi:MAG: tRNA glutamyl-Q(34) synthetase GluQRS [Desulfovibrionaceae bacterium]|nr:tRNA glutamyl-Q(34) synthetase GluQRS [Desulfovibrionaceae bacterium]
MLRPLRGRLAPSPTGLLHLGNAWAFLLAWLAARAEGGRVILRMEDIDPARSRPEWAEGILRDLRWLGLDWDEGPGVHAGSSMAESGPHAPYEQSRAGALYQRAFAALEAAGLVYPCYCTRRELRGLAGAPHGAADGLGDAGAFYPGTCRHLSPAERRQRERAGRHSAWRLACPEGAAESFDDAVLGPQSLTLAQCGGDFALRRSDGVWAYQLAVVVDDARMGVTQVVRGEDILLSTPRQLLLFRLLGESPPRYAHIPLLRDGAGERLAKRHHSLSLSALRDAGVRPEAVTDWLARAAGLGGGTPAEVAARLRREGTASPVFPWPRLPRGGLRLPDTLPDDLRRGVAPLPEPLSA